MQKSTHAMATAVSWVDLYPDNECDIKQRDQMGIVFENGKHIMEVDRLPNCP